MIEIAAALRAEVDRAAMYFRTIGEADASHSRGGGQWFKKEILGHLIDSAANNHQRFVRAQFADPFAWPGYDQEAWVSLHRYRERPWAELVELWVGLNRHLAAVIEAVPAEKLETVCQIGDAEAAPLEWWIRDYLRHLRHHLGQLEG
jgi:hypothetical protein